MSRTSPADLLREIVETATELLGHENTMAFDLMVDVYELPRASKELSDTLDRINAELEITCGACTVAIGAHTYTSNCSQ